MKRADEVSTLYPRFFKSSHEPAFNKTRCNSDQFHAVSLEHFCAHKIVIIFTQTSANDQETFSVVLHFVSRVTAIPMYYREVERRNTTV